MAARALKSAYEIARDARVLENQVLLQSLELPQVAAHAPSLKPKPQKRKADLPAAEPSRSSRRLRKEGPELGDGEPAPKLGGDLEGEATRGRETYETSYWSSRKAKYEELFRREREEGVELPKRATYEHTVGLSLSRFVSACEAPCLLCIRMLPPLFDRFTECSP
jgi:hypothetical protein